VTYTEIPLAADSWGPNKGPKVKKETVNIPYRTHTTAKEAKPEIELKVVRYEDTKLGNWEEVLQAIKKSCAGKNEEAKDTSSTTGN
jgi:hypothetical protein